MYKNYNERKGVMDELQMTWFSVCITLKLDDGIIFWLIP
jgi:hypothetical protein